MKPFSSFERICIINLPSRIDRRREMEGELRRIGIADDPRVQFVDGILVADKRPFRAPGEKGVFLAHLQILKDAAAAHQSVLILEDDVDFAPGAERWQPSSDCDIAYGGYAASDPSDLPSSDIIGAHCMGFSARAVQALAPYLEQLLEHESPPPIDGAYVWFRRQHPDFSTEFAEPVIAVQRPSRSDIARPKVIDRIPLLRAPIGIARKVKRRMRRAEFTFGLLEAVIISILGIAIASIAAYHYIR